MKILFPYMARWFAENWTRYHSLLEELGKQGHQIHILQPPPLPGSLETNYREIAPREMENIVIHDVKLNSKIWNTAFPFDKLVKKAYYSIASRKQAQLLARQHDIDCLLLYNIPQYSYMNIKNVKIAFDFADDYIDMLGHELGRLNIAPIRKLAQAMLNSMMRRADVVLSVSYELAKNATGNVQVLANGVDDTKLVNKGANSPHRKNDTFTVGFIGSFEYFIDLDLILDAAMKMPQVDFLLVGSGRDFAKVESRVTNEKIDNVRLTGGVTHDKVFEHIDEMDVCLNIFRKIPVSHRACPIKLFEYLSRHKPVISTRLDELTYIDTNKFLFYADSADELASVIDEIINNPEKSMEMAKTGKLEVETNYTWQKLAKKFVELTI